MITRLKELLFYNRSVKQTIVKNIFWLSISQVGSRLIKAAIIIYAARVLGVAEYGIFSYVLGLAGFFTIFTDIGVGTILTREVSQKSKLTSIYFTNAFWIKIVLLLITTLIMIYVAPYFSNIKEIKILLSFVSLLIIFDNIRELCISYLRAKEKMEYEALITTVTNIAITILGFLILQFYTTSKALILTYILGAGAGMLTAIYIIRKEFMQVFINFKRKVVKEIIINSWPIGLYGIIGSFMLNTDVVMLGWFKPTNEIGLYSAGQRIVQIFYTLPMIFASGTFPIIARLIKEESQEKIKLLTEKILIFVFLMAIPISLGGIILGESIINFIYGHEYVNGALSFKILVMTILFTFPTIAMGNLIIGFNKQNKIVTYTIIASLGNIFFNILLIPSYGINGAAISTLIVQCIYSLCMWHTTKKIINYHILRHIKKIIAGAIIMGLITLILNEFGINVIINIILSAGIYFGTLYLLKEKIVDEIKELFIKIK